MASREKPLDKEMAIFVRAHLGKHVFAPFTGTDARAWSAWCHLLRLYGSTEDVKAIDALRSTLECAQRKECIWEVFVQTIPGVLDWGYVKRLWPAIIDPIPPTMWPRDLTFTPSGPMQDGEVDTIGRRAALVSMCAIEAGAGGSPLRRHGLGWS